MSWLVRHDTRVNNLLLHLIRGVVLDSLMASISATVERYLQKKNALEGYI